jgi:hypothetical protein
MTIKNRKDKSVPLSAEHDFFKVIKNEDGYVLVQNTEDSDECTWYKVSQPITKVGDGVYVVMNAKKESLPIPADKSLVKALKREGKYVLCEPTYAYGTARWYELKAHKHVCV